MSYPTDFGNGDLPPPYSPSPIASASDLSSSLSLFSSHLANLRSQIAGEQAARTSALQDHDDNVLSLLVPYVEERLSSIAGMDPLPTLVEATMVPEAAVDSSWQLSDEGEERRGEVRMVIRVGQQAGSKSKSREKEGLDSQPEDVMLWWSDESMTRRLAKLLYPSPPPVRQRNDAQDAARGKRGAFWNLKSLKKGTGGGTKTPDRDSSLRGDDVTMAVRAEEVTFRKENEFGIWETLTGWGIVFRIRIRLV